MLTLTRKTVSLLVVLAVMITGYLPQMAAAADTAESESYSISSVDMANDAEPASAQIAAASATIQNYPMPSIYTASSVFSLKVGNQSVPVISYKDDYDYAQFSFSGTVSIEVTNNVPITSYSIYGQEH